MTRQHKEEKKENTFWVLRSPFPFWMNIVSTHNLMCCFGKFSLWGSTVNSSHSNMNGCMKIPESLLLQKVSTGGENFNIAFRNLIGKGDSFIRTRTMMLMNIVEEAKEHWGRANHGTSLYRIISET